MTKISIIIRTYNESKHIGELLEGIVTQRGVGARDPEVEIVVVDSGSTDGTIEIVQQYGVKLVFISKDEFSFGRSLNYGCRSCDGDIFVIVSGHCIPSSKEWLYELVKPILNGSAAYTYGRQIGGQGSRFSERQIFNKYFPEDSEIPQNGIYCNNANSALLRQAWEKFEFNEELTGLEDLDLARRLCVTGLKVAYVSTATVYHLHNETWSQVKNRFEREAVALKEIMPSVRFSMFDAIRCWVSAVILDCRAALKARALLVSLPEILMYRFHQYKGGYLGSNSATPLSREMKESYFYPNREGAKLYVSRGVK